MVRNEVLTECPIVMDPYLYGNKYGSISEAPLLFNFTKKHDLGGPSGGINHGSTSRASLMFA